jgi:uncharacterized protein
MNLTGTATLHGSASQVWAALTDPAVLARAIPGCELLEPAGPDSYRFTLTAGVASLRGTYSGVVALSHLQEPTSLVLTARGAGAPGTIATSIRIALRPDGAATEVSYDADATIRGLIASVGQRMLTSVAGLLIGEFLTSIDQVLTGNGVVSALPAPGQVPVPAAPEQSAGRAPAFVGGAVVGAAVTLAGVAVRGLIGRRSR